MAGSKEIKLNAYLAKYKAYSLKRSPAVGRSYLQRVAAWFLYFAALVFGPFSWIAVPQRFPPLHQAFHRYLSPLGPSSKDALWIQLAREESKEDGQGRARAFFFTAFALALVMVQSLLAFTLR